MKRLLIVALCLLTGVSCKKEKPADPGPYSGGGNPTPLGAAMAVRGAAKRIVLAAELHDLHLFMTAAKGASGRTPTSQETLAAMSQPDGNRKLVELIQAGNIILVPTPGDEGLWAYSYEAPTQGGWILTHAQPEQVTAQEFASRFGMN